MLKEATTHFYIFDESHFSNICTLWYATTECINQRKPRIFEYSCVNIGKTSEAAKPLFQWILVLNWVKQFSLLVSSKKVTKVLKMDIEFIQRKQQNTYTMLIFLFRSSHWRCSIKKSVLKNFVIFVGKRLCLSFFFNKVAKYCKILKNTYVGEHLRTTASVYF